MKTSSYILSLVLLCLVPWTQLEAQHRVPDVFVVDAKGLWQWKTFKPSACKVCPRGDKPCISCFGTKKISKNPVLVTICYQCAGAKKTPCKFCWGQGTLKVQGGSKKGNRCMCCNGKGTFKCSLCRGKGSVSTVKISGKTLLKAPLKGLKAAQDDLSLLSRTFRMPTSNLTDSKKGKDFAKKMKPFAKYLSAATNQGKGLISILKALSRGQRFTDHQTTVRATIDRHRKGILNQTKVNLDYIKLAIMRHEFNAKHKSDED